MYYCNREKSRCYYILSNYDDDDYSKGYGQIKEAFRALSIENILKPYRLEDDFRSYNDGDNIGYNIYSFDSRYQKFFGSAESVKLKFEFSANTLPGIYGYSLVLTNRLVSICSYGQRMLDLV